MVTCPICYQKMNYINNSHLKTHSLTPGDFKEKFPEAGIISLNVRKALSYKGLSRESGKEKNKLIRLQKLEKIKKEFYNLKKCCQECNRPMPFEKKDNIFCSSSCSASFNNKKIKKVYSKAGLKKIQEIGKRNIIFAQNGWIRRPATEIQKICCFCNKNFIVNYKKKNTKTCSPQCKNNWHSANNFKQTKTYGKCGYYDGIYCASSWELAFLIFNKDMGTDIERCSLTFKYFNTKERLYFPDFIIDGIIYEIKGFENSDVELKTQAVKNAGHTIRLIRKKEITPIIKYVQQMYDIKDITVLYDKNDQKT